MDCYADEKNKFNKKNKERCGKMWGGRGYLTSGVLVRRVCQTEGGFPCKDVSNDRLGHLISVPYTFSDEASKPPRTGEASCAPAVGVSPGMNRTRREWVCLLRC